MPGPGAREMAGPKGKRTVAGSLLPRRIYATAENRRFSSTECARDCRLLFRAAAETLLTIAADRKRLGADIGFLAVLHTWGQNLHLHPHVHCVVPGGGLAADGTRWVACRPGFFLPVRVLSRLFRGKFLALLQEAFAQRRLGFYGQQQGLADPA